MSGQLVFKLGKDDKHGIGFDVPKGVSKPLVSRALEAVNRSGDLDIITEHGLTKAETEFALYVIETLTTEKQKRASGQGGQRVEGTGGEPT